MTRRVRFTPFLRAGVFAGVTGLAGLAHASEVPFAAPLPVHTLAGPVSHWAPADIDGDADVDLLVAAPAEGRLLLLRNVDGAGASWSAVTVSTATSDVRDTVAGDIDGDGDLDAASVSHPSGLLAWHENLDGNGTAWATHTIATDAGPAVEVGDIDRDGNLDVIAMPSANFGTLRWFRNGGGGTSWTTYMVGFGTPLEPTIDVVDIDGDGDPDILTTAGGNDTWWENPNAPETLWTFHTAGLGGQPGIAPGDMDRDGDPDVISQFSWYENTPAGIGPMHLFFVPGGFGAQMPTPADVDGDGDLDFWANELTGSIVWYDNLTGDGLQLVRRLLTIGSDPSEAMPIDLDGDGDLDGISASGPGPTPIVRHMNETLHRSTCFAPPVTISTAPDTARSVAPADIDRDGDVDLVTTHSNADTLLWHENSASGAGWTPHTLATSINFPAGLATADLDRDGDTDVVSDFAPIPVPIGTLWFENTLGGGVFTAHTIATTALTAAITSRVATGDVDGDGDADVLQSGYDLIVRWYGNSAGNGSTWAPAVPIGGTSGQLADFDGDGDLDLASARDDFTEHHLGWAENVGGTGATWSMHTISTEVGSRPVVTAGDIDGDGDVDFAQGGGGSSPVRWRINEGAGSSWSLQTVDGAGEGAIVADLDGDGDLDLPWAATPPTFGWHENRNGLGSEWLGHTLPLTGSPAAGGMIRAADLDRDGDLDLIGNPASLVWYPNQGGQFSLAADNTAPGTADQGSTVSMLRVVVTHLGRAGDGPLELARFGVRLEEAAGDPLTSAEANLLIESLRVYRDANGNGIFDPADALVTSIGTLALAAGVQDVPFADGDTNVTVEFGTPRTYFVVVELTADAATQNPNRVRATLLQLGPSASQAEHAAYDLPLAPACPADVSSVVMVATVPVELMGFTIE